MHAINHALRSIAIGVGLAAAIASCSAVGGSPLASEPLPSGTQPAASFVPAPAPLGIHTGVAGRVLAGPTCPVESSPPQPGCQPRAVAGAVIVIRDSQGHDVARITSDRDGMYRADLPPGTYTLTPQPVPGLIGTARPEQVTIPAGGAPGPTVDLNYDTGIR